MPAMAASFLISYSIGVFSLFVFLLFCCFCFLFSLLVLVYTFTLRKGQEFVKNPQFPYQVRIEDLFVSKSDRFSLESNTIFQ